MTGVGPLFNEVSLPKASSVTDGEKVVCLEVKVGERDYAVVQTKAEND